MIIRKVEEDQEHPFCPECGVPLWMEALAPTTQEMERIKDIISRVASVPPTGPRLPHFKARLMRCPECASLYHVED